MSTYLDKVQNDSIIIQLKELLDEFPEVSHYKMDKVDYPQSKVGKGNPYYICTGCKKTNVEITNTGHLKTCKWKVSSYNFKLLLNQLNKWEYSNLELIIDELDR